MNLMRYYLKTVNFAYSIVYENRVIDRDQDTLLADTFDPIKFIESNNSNRLISFYKLGGQNILIAVINFNYHYYLIGPILIESGSDIQSAILLSNTHLKRFTISRYLTIIKLCIRLLGAYINPHKIYSRYKNPQIVNNPLNDSLFIKLADQRAHVNYAFEKQVNNAVLSADQKQIHHALNNLYKSGRIGVLSNKGDLRNIIDFGIIVISTNIRVALRNGINFETAYSLNDYYVHHLEQQQNIHAVIKCIEDCLVDLSQQITHNITNGMPPSIVWAYHLAFSDPQKAMTVKAVSKELNMSVNYFSSLFKKQVGISFTKLRTLTRLNYAITLLISTNMRISSIANYLNFSDQAYFSNQLKKYTNFSPKQVRNNPALVENWNIRKFLTLQS